MDMSLLKNKIIFIVGLIAGIYAVTVGIFGYAFLDGSLASSLYLIQFTEMIAAVALMLVFTLAFNTNIVSYLLSISAWVSIVFQLYYLFFDDFVQFEYKRWILRGIGVILAIIWVHIAKKIREKI